MLDVVNLLIYGAIVSAISFFVILFLTPAAIRSLAAKGKTVPDAHKQDKPLIPRPAGPVIMAGIATAEIVLYLLTMNAAVLAVLLATAIAFAVGYIDDSRVMPGWFKPVALLAAAVPLVALNFLYPGEVHSDSLNLIFGRAFIPLLYIPLIFVIMPITGNTINSIDVLNGVASGFIIIATIPLLASIAIFGSHEVFLAALPLLFAAIAFYKYHKFPSRIFPGDSGTLLLGAMYGALAIAGSSEIIGVIALLPAVMNSFLFLASVKRIVEHRQVKARPTVLLDDYKLAASTDSAAPATLVRLIVADRPLGEKEVGYKIFKLAAFTALLAFVSIAIQYYVVIVRL
ncbi:putative glycosyl transferase, family 4 [Candidatus Nitrososphaera gargensis Ga9.2]|uniref:Putative glycosyl transferase, family 4 n=1 Tax=Nitrososphaera gargensis (strain Ga9.2) TaxID=1237085 RepID=K0IDG1_NITGG|nr:UDP-N-acetylglucosamine-1-phosphate transferase [Candidatus Nitrososphaera gargensis]AFU57675.1 putative glycosyl transferase, family 4 [Candidatus Nitrososphaera gargensis Ga9.2]